MLSPAVRMPFLIRAVRPLFLVLLGLALSACAGTERAVTDAQAGDGFRREYSNAAIVVGVAGAFIGGIIGSQIDKVSSEDRWIVVYHAPVDRYEGR